MGRQRKVEEMNSIPPLVYGRNSMYCPQFCGVKWDGRGKRRARKVHMRYRLHWLRRHAANDND